MTDDIFSMLKNVVEKNGPHQLLHAHRLEFPHPEEKDRVVAIEAPVPEPMKTIVNVLRVRQQNLVP